MQQFLKPPPGSAWTEVVAPEFFGEFLVDVDEPAAPLNAALRWESLAAFAGGLERRAIRHAESNVLRIEIKVSSYLSFPQSP